VIDRRYNGSASLSALEFIHYKDRWYKVGRENFALLTRVNHISFHPEAALLSNIFVVLEILSSEYQLYACGKISRTPRS